MVTENQSGSNKVTLSLTCRILELFLSHCEEEMSSDDTALARKMHYNLSSYSIRIRTPLANLAKTLDPRIRNYNM